MSLKEEKDIKKMDPRTPSFSPEDIKQETNQPKTPEEDPIIDTKIEGKKSKPTLFKDETKKKKFGVFIRCVSTEKICIAVSNIGGNITNTLKSILSKKIEGKCGENGYIKEGSTGILSYSNGICKGSSIVFDIVFECEVCNPVQGMIIECVVKNITKAGIRAELEGYENSPIVIFIARDHHYSLKEFSSVTEGEKINIKVVGQRFELNDKYVSVIAELDVKDLKKKLVLNKKYL
jgi:DNA-directed RNA polymerase subunit E'/Rpb7